MRGMGMARGVAAALGVGVLAAAAVHATSLRPLPLAKASRRATAVVVGTVASTSCRRAATPAGRTRIFTDADLVDLSVPLGSVATRNVIVSVVGGTLDGRTLRVPGAPRLEAGRRYVVFLDPGEPLCGIAGWTQGVFRVERDGAGTDRVYAYDGSPVGSVEGGRAVLGRDPMALGDFLAAVGDLARSGPAGPEGRLPRGGAGVEEGGR